MSPLSPGAEGHAGGAALNEAWFRAGKIVPIRLLGPLVDKWRAAATQGQARSAVPVISFSQGKAALHSLGLFFGWPDFNGLRSPLPSGRSGWV